MRKTAIILAAAAVFDLGVMVVSVQGQEGVFRPSNGSSVVPGSTSNGANIDQDAQLRACANGKHFPDAPLSACRDTAPPNPSGSSGPAGQARAVDMFIKIDLVNNVRACNARQGTVVVVEGHQQCRIPANGSGPTSGPIGRPPGGIPPRN